MGPIVGNIAIGDIQHEKIIILGEEIYKRKCEILQVFLSDMSIL